MRKGFLEIDVSLNDGGKDELVQMKKEKPPVRAAIMNVLTQISKAKNGEDGEGADDEFA